MHTDINVHQSYIKIKRVGEDGESLIMENCKSPTKNQARKA